MAESVVAYRYAKSLIDLANEKKVVEEVSKDMALFKEVCDGNRQFLAVMGNPIVRHEKKLGILKKVFENNVHPVTFSIFKVLTNKNRENLIYAIAEEFQKIYNDQNGIQRATVTTTSALTDEQRKAFIKVVADATGRKVILEEKINENLIGGYVLQVDDKQIDTSVKRKLNDLKLNFA
ncbi:MAG: ATP synthase F1 subunit delta [Spirosomataceae bacterium]